MKNMKFWRTVLVATLVLTVMLSVTGGTIAWFTDSVTSAENKIQAGKLDVELLMYKDGSYVNIGTNEEAIFGSDILWEPGKTHVAYLAIKNAGNLAIKYSVSLDVEAETKNLSKAMLYAIKPDAQYGGVTSWAAADAKAVTAGVQKVSGDVSLAVGATHYFALSIHMDEAAGNEYQEGTVDFDVTVYATQDTVEYDSFGQDYDKPANYLVTVNNASELAAAMTGDGDIEVNGTINDTELEAYSDTRNVVALYRPTGDSTLSGGKIVLDNTAANWGFVVDAKNNVNVTVKDTEIVGNNNWNMHNIVEPGSTLTIDNVKVSASGGNGIYVMGGGNAVINNASVTQEGLNEGAQPWAPTAVAVSSASNVTINGGTYTGATYGVYIYNSGAVVTINGGTFKAPQVLKADGSYTDQTIRGEFIVNGGEFDGQLNMTNGYAYMAINGGNFKNFSVSTYSPVVIKGGTFDTDPTQWLAAGYIATESNGVWTVSAE